jgi:hypothetical protein
VLEVWKLCLVFKELEVCCKDDVADVDADAEMEIERESLWSYRNFEILYSAKFMLEKASS